MNATDRLNKIVRQNFVDSNIARYQNAFEAAGGVMPGKYPPLFAKTKETTYWDGKGWWRWTTKKDGNGNWWSFRLVPGTVNQLSHFERHDQRQAAKNMAAVNAKLHRNHPPTKVSEGCPALEEVLNAPFRNR